MRVTTRQDNVSRRQVRNVPNLFKKCLHSGIWWLYLESSWKMHSDKNKHVWYWFINSRNRRLKISNILSKSSCNQINRWSPPGTWENKLTKLERALFQINDGLPPRIEFITFGRFMIVVTFPYVSCPLVILLIIWLFIYHSMFSMSLVSHIINAKS